MKPILEIKDLTTYFYTDDGIVHAVEDVSLTLNEGETIGIVGESGCGKSVTALSILRLIPMPPGKIESGEVIFDGIDLMKMSSEEHRRLRGNRIAMIFQDPMTSLNPFLRISRQLTEPLEVHKDIRHREALKRAIDMLSLVEIPSPSLRIHDYPHQFSGGMRQRVMIAMSLICEPRVLIADEPTTALDVTIQAQILDLLKKIQAETGTAILLITHDLGIVAGMCSKIFVMYAGRVVESAPTDILFQQPLHPYTLGLLRSLPRLDQSKKERLTPIEGLPPDLIHFPPGCHYSPRCEFAINRCREEAPPLLEVVPRHKTACWVWMDLAKRERK